MSTTISGHYILTSIINIFYRTVFVVQRIRILPIIHFPTIFICVREIWRRQLRFSGGADAQTRDGRARKEEGEGVSDGHRIKHDCRSAAACLVFD